MKRSIQSAAVALYIATVVVTSVAQSSFPDLKPDGWHSWHVDAIESAPSSCCYEWRGGTSVKTHCTLDDDQQGFHGEQRLGGGAHEKRVYARMVAGKPDRLRVLDSDCPIATGAVKDHGLIATADSVAWLTTVIDPRTRRSDEALAAIAMHAGDAARDTLLHTARGNDDSDNRKHAMFWIGQVRSHELADELRALMMTDPDATMREHAAFAWSQSGVPDRGAALIELARNDHNVKVRGQAWFWLAQTGEKNSEAAILSALKDERSEDVRRQAIFALSQLPEKRAVDALIKVVEGRRLADGDRKHALFWLAQDGSEQALAYISGVLGR